MPPNRDDLNDTRGQEWPRLLRAPQHFSLAGILTGAQHLVRMLIGLAYLAITLTLTGVLAYLAFRLAVWAVNAINRWL